MRGARRPEQACAVPASRQCVAVGLPELRTLVPAYVSCRGMHLLLFIIVGRYAMALSFLNFKDCTYER